MGSVGVHLVLAGPEERKWVWEIALLKEEAGAHPIAVLKILKSIEERDPQRED